VCKYPKDNSFTLTTYASLSTSNAKQQFSFSKAERFNVLRGFSTDKMYEMPSQLSARGAGMGYGKKLDLAKARNGKARA
jgi:hypothetical protein